MGQQSGRSKAGAVAGTRGLRPDRVLEVRSHPPLHLRHHAQSVRSATARLTARLGAGGHKEHWRWRAAHRHQNGETLGCSCALKALPFSRTLLAAEWCSGLAAQTLPYMFSKPRWRSESVYLVLFTDVEKAHSTLSHQRVVNVVAAATPEMLPLARLSRRGRDGAAAVDATEGTP
jgi:hypothetical protein